MQAVKTTSDRTTRRTDNKGIRNVDKKRGVTKKTGDTSSRNRNHYLTTVFSPVACQSIVTGGQECLTRENYIYLRDSAENYAKLLKKELKHIEKEAIGESINDLYVKLKKILPKGQDLNIEDGSVLQFCIYQKNEWPAYCFFFLPIKFIEDLDGKMRKIAVSFLNRFIKTNGLNGFNDSDDFDTDFVLQNLEEQIEGRCFDEEEKKKMRELFDSYTKGDIHNLFREVETTCYYKDLKSVIRRYKPNNGWEKELLESFKDGLKFIEKDSIMWYNYDPDEDDNNDYMPVRLDRVVRVIYSDDDYFTEVLEEVINMDLQNTYDITPNANLFIDPQTKVLFSKGDYPEKFHKWFTDFFKLIEI